jgi:hypothetical protein
MPKYLIEVPQALIVLHMLTGVVVMVITKPG